MSRKIILWSGDVEKRVPLSKATVDRKEALGEFPKRVQLSSGRVGWFEDEIEGGLANLPRGPLPQRPALRRHRRAQRLSVGGVS